MDGINTKFLEELDKLIASAGEYSLGHRRCERSLKPIINGSWKTYRAKAEKYPKDVYEEYQKTRKIPIYTGDSRRDGPRSLAALLSKQPVEQVLSELVDRLS